MAKANFYNPPQSSKATTLIPLSKNQLIQRRIGPGMASPNPLARQVIKKPQPLSSYGKVQSLYQEKPVQRRLAMNQPSPGRLPSLGRLPVVSYKDYLM